MDLFNSQCS